MHFIKKTKEDSFVSIGHKSTWIQYLLGFMISYEELFLMSRQFGIGSNTKTRTANLSVVRKFLIKDTSVGLVS